MDGHPVADVVFRLELARRPTWQRLFLAHPDELLLMMDGGEVGLGVPVPLLFVDNLPDDPQLAARIYGPFQDASKGIAERQEQLSKYFEGLADELFGDIGALAVIAAVRLVGRNPALLSAAQGGTIELRTVRRLIGQGRLDWELFDELEDGWEADEKVARTRREFQSRFDGYVKRLRAWLRSESDAVQLAPTMASQVPFLYGLGYRHLRDLLRIRGLTREEYLGVLADLYRSKMLHPAGFTGWCSSGDHTPFTVSTVSAMPPGEMRGTCSLCGEGLAWAGAYALDPAVFQAIKAKDGVAAVVIEEFARANRTTSFRRSVQLDGKEVDFVFEAERGTTVVEVKMFMQNRADIALSRSIGELVAQVARAREAALREGHMVADAVGVLNVGRGTVKRIQHLLRAEERSELESGRVKLVQVEDVLSEVQGGW